MFADFGRKFPNTCVILDATELPINKPSDVNAQSITLTAYKHKNTPKTMIGCTPKGAIIFVSKAYGGSASDRQINENSELLNPDLKMFEKGYSVWYHGSRPLRLPRCVCQHSNDVEREIPTGSTGSYP